MERLGEIARFGLVGAFNAGTYFGIFAAGVLAGVPYLVAATVAFVISATIGYWLHEHWTFKGAAPTVRAWLAWVGAQAGGIALNMVLLVVLVDAFGAGPLIAQLVLMPVPPVATYLVGRRWVFS